MTILDHYQVMKNYLNEKLCSRTGGEFRVTIKRQDLTPSILHYRAITLHVTRNPNVKTQDTCAAK